MYIYIRIHIHMDIDMNINMYQDIFTQIYTYIYSYVYVYISTLITVILGIADMVLSAINSLEKRAFIRFKPSVFTVSLLPISKAPYIRRAEWIPSCSTPVYDDGDV
jgi:hypothetical protein